MKNHQSCPACNSEYFSSLKRYENEKLSKCQNCHLVFTLKTPSEDELGSHYEQYSRNDFLSPITVSRYNELLTKFEPFKDKGRILDIGCGSGYFLDQAKKSDWLVHGSEFTDDAVDICENKGIKMHKGSLESIDFGDLKFDVITSFEVLEHLNNPQIHIQKISSLLRKGGLLYLTTPNFNSFNSRYLKERWNVISYPEHLCYYNNKSLHELLVKNGFNRQTIKTEGISPGRLMNSKKNQHMDFTSSDTQDENLRESIEKSPLLRFAKKSVNSGLSLLGLGETLKAYYVKS